MSELDYGDGQDHATASTAEAASVSDGDTLTTYQCIVHTEDMRFLAAHRTPAVWGVKEAIFTGGQWVGIYPFEIVTTEEIDSGALPETVTLQCSWGELVFDGDLLAEAE